MKCNKCGFDMPEQAKFCMMCGAAVEKDVTCWADCNVDVSFENLRLNDDNYFFCFRFKNHSAKNIVPILYSLTVNGTPMVKDIIMKVLSRQDQKEDIVQNHFFAGTEIFVDDEVLCCVAISRKKIAIDPKNPPQILVSPAYCLRGESGYNYGADQHNFAEQPIRL